MIVGVGQVNEDDANAPEPAQLLAEASRRAITDSGAPRIVAAVESVKVVRIVSWRYMDPGRLVAHELGMDGVHTVVSTHGGHTPQVLLDRAALDILAGRVDVVLIGGAESFKTRVAFDRRHERPPWTRQDPDVKPDEVVGDKLKMMNDVEQSVGLSNPPEAYALCESALWTGSNDSRRAHLAAIGGLWKSFSEVAANNATAALPRHLEPDQIVTPTSWNRMIAFPYTKLLSSNSSVNQAAALLVCSAERARSLGIDRSRWVFPIAAAEANEVPFLSNRRHLDESLALRACNDALFSRRRLSIDEVQYLDVYSCFPSAVEIAAAELGVTDRRPLTVTGGSPSPVALGTTT